MQQFRGRRFRAARRVCVTRLYASTQPNGGRADVNPRGGARSVCHPIIILIH